MWSLMFQFCAVSSKHGGFNFIVNACAVSTVHKGFDFVVNACALPFEDVDLAYMLQSGESLEPRIPHALRFLISSIFGAFFMCSRLCGSGDSIFVKFLIYRPVVCPHQCLN